MRNKRLLIALSCILIISLMFALTGCGTKKASFPNKPIKIIVPFAAGGGTDLVARKFAEVMPKYLPNNTTVVVENKAGGSGVLGTSELLASPADGYTLEIAVFGVLSVQPHFGKANYTWSDPTPIIRILNEPTCFIVPADSPFKTFEEWLDYCKKNPEKYTYANPGKGTAAHINTEAAALAAGIKLTGVPFDGTAPAITALLGNHVMGACVQLPEARTFVEGGKVKVLWMTGKSAMYPDVAVLKDKGINAEGKAWTGFIGPKNLPADVRTILHDAFKKAMDDPSVVESFKKMGNVVDYANGEDFKKAIGQDFENNGKVLKAVGLIQ